MEAPSGKARRSTGLRDSGMADWPLLTCTARAAVTTICRFVPSSSPVPSLPPTTERGL